ncbi:ubiquitin-conjugating enzyme E2-binding protein [Dendryphion nanum]|uniref:Ubiquitin-conjugating enzyme E2-binding protein n=1 Tax=Dendryphion nanum TaxID=256645 RepID=A0A9P9DRX0_9PLEO|nr:ubiquitin-conjugating enzyme E2-binding protein [Dendryphion nanum]
MSASSLPKSAFDALDLPSETVNIITTPQPPPATDASPNVLQAAPGSARDLAPNQSAITLYAELLLHIRTVTLFASLQTVHNKATKAQLSADGSSITITHEGASATICLPIKADGGGDAALTLPAQPPSKELSLRLQIEEKEGTEFLVNLQAEERKVNVVPWDGASLNKLDEPEVRCKNCRGTILSKDKISEWRDLPNENWAEMMDFWHCHKPDEHHLHDHSHDDTMAQKGYAASNRLSAISGVGFVDLVSFLLKEQDCDSVNVGPVADSSQPTLLVCRQCDHPLGTSDGSANGWRIWKWSVDVASSGPQSQSLSQPNTFNVQKWISARLIFLIENQGVRKFHIHPDADPSSIGPSPSLLIWVFTPDLLFSSSIPFETRRDPTRAMKVFFEEKTYNPPKAGEPESATVEDVAFPKTLFEELGRALKDSQRFLPLDARQFKGWDVGLLERFKVVEVNGPSEVAT